MHDGLAPAAGSVSRDAETPVEVRKNRFLTLTLGSIGVVYGDIGTSPLYAFREAVMAAGGGAASREAVFGVLSLILWALILIVTCKYALRPANRVVSQVSVSF